LKIENVTNKKLWKTVSFYPWYF